MFKFIFSYLSFLIPLVFYGQNCNCDLLLEDLSASSFNTIDGNDLSYQPGDTICISSGTYAGILFTNLKGESDDYITIINCGGKVVISETSKSGITFRNSKYIHLTGTGVSEYEFGIHIQDAQGPGATGINLSNFSSDFEIDFIEIENTDFAGILGKTDPSCDWPATWRRNGYILKNVSIHDNYIHDTGGEGIYLGYTGGFLVESNKTCDGEFVFGHWLEDIKIYDNTLMRTGWDAIQVNLARKRAEIYGNNILSYGLANRTFQKFAMSIAGGEYFIFNNYIINPEGGNGQGIQLLSALSGSKLFNNLIINPNFHGIFIHNRHEFDNQNIGYLLANNTIVRPRSSGIFYNTLITRSENADLLGSDQRSVPTYFINNLIIDPGNRYENSDSWKNVSENYIDFNTRRTRNESVERIITNLFTREADDLCLASIEEDDYRPAFDSSPLVDAGTELESFQVSFDINKNNRFFGKTIDIGAYEYQGEILDFNCVGFGDDVIETDFDDETVVLSDSINAIVRILNSRTSYANIELFSQGGTLLKSFRYTIGTDFSIRNLASGIYLLKIDFGDYTEYHKIMRR